MQQDVLFTLGFILSLHSEKQMSVFSNLTGKFFQKLKYLILHFRSMDNDPVGKTKPS